MAIWMAIMGTEVSSMSERFTIAEARNSLTRLVRRAEARAPVVLTRRGRPVAVLLSYEDFTRLAPQRSYVEALAEFRRVRADDLADLAEALEGGRDRSTGREVAL